MTHRTSAPMKARKDIGEVVHPIEKLMAAGAAGSSWVLWCGMGRHIEADLKSDSGLTRPVKDRSRPAVRGIIETEWAT